MNSSLILCILGEIQMKISFNLQSLYIYHVFGPFRLGMESPAHMTELSPSVLKAYLFGQKFSK